MNPTRSLLASTVALTLSLCLNNAAPGGDWPQFLGPDRNGVSAETGLVDSWPKEGPPVGWQKDIGEGFSGPVVAGDTVILFHRAGGEEVVEGLDATTGKERWQHRYATRYRDDFGKGNGPRATPLVAGKHVFTLGAEGRLHCLEVDTGNKVWEHDLLDEYSARKGFFGVGTSPLLEGRLLLVNVGGRGAGIVAFEANTGREAWKVTSDEASYSSPVAATIDGTRHVFFFTREGLVALDPARGTVRFTKRWRSRQNASVNAAAPVVLDGHVFLTASYNTGAVLLHVRPDGVDEVWQSDDVLSAHYGTPVRQGDFLYGFDGRQEEGPRLRCIEWKTGKVRWTQEGFGCGSMVLADGRLYVLTESGDLVLVSATPDGYRELARAHVLEGPCRGQLALANGRLYGRDDHKMVCWNIKK
jgi:outer membrane protein assembly factor BamB